MVKLSKCRQWSCSADEDESLLFFTPFSVTDILQLTVFTPQTPPDPAPLWPRCVRHDCTLIISTIVTVIQCDSVYTWTTFPSLYTVNTVQCCTTWYRPLVRSMLSEYVTICIANHAWYPGTDSLKYFLHWPLTTVLYLSPDDASCDDHTPAHVWSPVLFITRCSSNTQYFQIKYFWSHLSPWLHNFHPHAAINNALKIEVSVSNAGIVTTNCWIIWLLN